MNAVDELAQLFPPMIHPDGGNITAADLERHYQTHHLPPRDMVDQLMAQRDQEQTS